MNFYYENRVHIHTVNIPEIAVNSANDQSFFSHKHTKTMSDFKSETFSIRGLTMYKKLSLTVPNFTYEIGFAALQSFRYTFHNKHLVVVMQRA